MLLWSYRESTDVHIFDYSFNTWYRTGFSEPDIAAVWLKSARLFRKNGHIGPAYNAVMHAAQLKAKSATIEHSRLMWTDGHHRKAIQTLKGAIAANAFVAEESEMSVRASVSMTGEKQTTQNILAAKVSFNEHVKNTVRCLRSSRFDGN